MIFIELFFWVVRRAPPILQITLTCGWQKGGSAFSGNIFHWNSFADYSSSLQANIGRLVNFTEELSLSLLKE